MSNVSNVICFSTLVYKCSNRSVIVFCPKTYRNECFLHNISLRQQQTGGRTHVRASPCSSLLTGTTGQQIYYNQTAIQPVSSVFLHVMYLFEQKFSHFAYLMPTVEKQTSISLCLYYWFVKVDLYLKQRCNATMDCRVTGFDLSDCVLWFHHPNTRHIYCM